MISNELFFVAVFILLLLGNCIMCIIDLIHSICKRLKKNKCTMKITNKI